MSNLIKQSTLNLFLDNVVDNITAADMREFVNNVWGDKENSIRKLNNLSNITAEVGIEQNDVIVCTTGADEGLYIALVANPTVADLQKITSQISEIPNGVDGQILSQQNGQLVWIDRGYTFQVVGTLPINDIMLERPQAGITYIAADSSTTATVPGVIGDGYTWNGLEWINIGQMRGVQGIQGLPGNPGADGDGFRFKGSDTVANILLKSSTGTPATIIGDVWMATDIGTDSAGLAVAVGDSLACSNPDIPTWHNIGLFAGKDGIDGTNGIDGLSAYELAVNQGFVGTETQWLASLKGADGTNGTNGVDGLSAYQIAVNQGFVGTETQWITSLKGADGIDGAPGADSTVPGPNGLSAYEIAVNQGFVGTETQWLASLKGADGINGTNGVDGINGTDATVVFASQATVDAGVSTTEVISPATLNNSSQLASKEPVIAPGLANQVFVTDNTGTTKGWVDQSVVAPVRSVNGKTGTFNITALDVGLGNVDNTADLNKPVSTAVQAELNLKSDVGHNHTTLNDTLYEPKNINIQAHITDTANPHNVDKIQVGLGNIPNLLPADWPISNAVAAEFLKTYKSGGDATFNDMNLFLEANTLFQTVGTFLNAPVTPMKGVSIVQEATASRHAVQHYFDVNGDTWSRSYDDDLIAWSPWVKNATQIDIQSIQDGTLKTTGFTPTVPNDFATKQYVDDTTASGGLTQAQVAAMYNAEAVIDPTFFVYSDVEKNKLAGIEVGATADQTDAEIVAAYQAGNPDYYTLTEKNKLAGIEVGATADMTGAEIAAAYELYADVERFTTAYKTIVNNTSGINTGDQDVTNIEGMLYDGTRDNNKLSDANLAKLNILSSDNYFKGTYLNDTLLADSWGPGSTNGNPIEGSYAYIDNNVTGVFEVRIWDMSNNIWKPVTSSGTGTMTVAEIEALLYDGTRNNNKYTDADKLKLAGVFEATAPDVISFTGSGYVTAQNLANPINNLQNTLQTNIDTNTTAIATKENSLGNPGVDGQVLSSTAAGVRSWISLDTNKQTSYSEFTAVASVPGNTTMYVDSADSELKFKYTAGNVINITGARADYKLTNTDASVSSLTAGANIASRLQYNASELAFVSDLPDVTALTDISYLAGVTSVNNKLQYLQIPVDYAVDYSNLAVNDVVAKGHLEVTNAVVSNNSSLINNNTVKLNNLTSTIYAEVLSVPPTLAEIQTALDISLGGNGTSQLWAGTERDFTLHSVPLQATTELPQDRVPTASYTVRQRLIGSGAVGSAGSVDEFYVDAITKAV